MCVAANASKLFCMTHLANIERFLYHSNLLFSISSFIWMQIRQLELTKINSSARRYIFSRKLVKFTQDELFSIFKGEKFLRVCARACVTMSISFLFKFYTLECFSKLHSALMFVKSRQKKYSLIRSCFNIESLMLLVILSCCLTVCNFYVILRHVCFNIINSHFFPNHVCKGKIYTIDQGRT